MFERMQELLKDQPDWLEVPMPTGMYEDLKQALVQFGASPEQAVNLCVVVVVGFLAMNANGSIEGILFLAQVLRGKPYSLRPNQGQFCVCIRIDINFQVWERLLDVIGIDLIFAVANDGDALATLTLGHDFGDVIEIA